MKWFDLLYGGVSVGGNGHYVKVLQWVLDAAFVKQIGTSVISMLSLV